MHGRRAAGSVSIGAPTRRPARIIALSLRDLHKEPAERGWRFPLIGCRGAIPAGGAQLPLTVLLLQPHAVREAMRCHPCEAAGRGGYWPGGLGDGDDLDLRQASEDADGAIGVQWLESGEEED